MLKEFKEFISKGNVMDLAIGVIIGAAFGKIVDSLVKDIIMPPIGMALGKADFSQIRYVLIADADPKKEVAIRFGAFFNEILTFVIVAFAVFVLVKGINKLKREPAAEAPVGPTPTESLLTEIRDALKK